MGGNLLVINVDIRETRVALVENGIIAELHIERHNSKSTLGNIYLGTVSRVLPGMQAAFIDIGLERAAFLHVEDLIRPDDLDAYLAQTRSALAGDAAAAADLDEEGAFDDEEPLDADGYEEGDEEEGRYDDEPDDDEGDDGSRYDDDDERRDDDDDDDDDDERRDDDDDGAPYDDDDDDGRRDDDDERRDDDDERRDDDDDDDDDGVVLEEPGDGAIDATGAPRADHEARGATAEKDDGSGTRGERSRSEADDPVQGELWTSATDDPPANADRAGDQAAHADGWPEGASDPAQLLTSEVPEHDEAPAEPPEETPPEEGDTAEGGKRRARKTRVPRSGRTMRTRRSSKASKSASNGERRSGGRRDGKRSGPSRDSGKRDGGRRNGNRRNGGRQDGRGRSRRSSDKGKREDRNRISKSTPIREVVREGQHVLVQVSKEPIGTKGARVTSHVSLPGRYVVYLPTVEHVGISKRIGSGDERSRLRAAIESVKPPTGGLVVRTVAEGMTKKQLKTDVGYLVTLWADIARKREEAAKAPCLLYEELDLVLKTARDLFTDDVDQIVIDDREQYGRLRRFLEVFMPERIRDVKLYEGREPVFDAYGIEDEIGRALSRKVPLRSGGHLVIDQAEALTAIDVNTGRFVGKGSKDLEETILQTNLEAVEEIAYQLRFRNIGGLIILDLIDMEKPSNREKVRRRLEELLSRDKAKTTLNRISDLGLIEMTRKRTRESLGRLLHEPCFYCDGTGQIQSKQTIAYEIARQIRREMHNLKGYRITVNAHPAIVDLLQHEERELIQESERRSMRRIELVPRKEYHIEQFDLQGL